MKIIRTICLCLFSFAALSAFAQAMQMEKISVTASRENQIEYTMGEDFGTSGCGDCEMNVAGGWDVWVAKSSDIRCVTGYTTVTSYSSSSLRQEAADAVNSDIAALTRAWMSAVGRPVEIRWADGGLEYFVPTYSGGVTLYGWQGGSATANGGCPV